MNKENPYVYDPLPQPRHFVSRAKVIAEFVDEIPKSKYVKRGNLTTWVPEPETLAGLQKAYDNPGQAMLFCEYNVRPPSKGRALAQGRERALVKQGYSEEAGWVVRAVDNRVYVLFQGEP